MYVCDVAIAIGIELSFKSHIFASKNHYSCILFTQNIPHNIPHYFLLSHILICVEMMTINDLFCSFSRFKASLPI